MSSKEQKTPNEQVSEEMEQHAHHDDTLPEAAEGVDLRDARIAELEAQLAEAQQHERDSCCAPKRKRKTSAAAPNWTSRKRTSSPRRNSPAICCR